MHIWTTVYVCMYVCMYLCMSVRTHVHPSYLWRFGYWLFVCRCWYNDWCMHLVSISVWMCMYSSDVEWYRRESGTRPPDGHTSARLGMTANLCVHFLPNPCIECRLLGPAAMPPRPIALLSPPLVAVLPDRYKKSNRKHNSYSVSIIWTHIHAYIHAYR